MLLLIETLVGGLLLALAVDQLLDAMATVGSPLVQPRQRHRQHRALPLQRPGQLGDERAGQRRPGARHVGDDQDHVHRVLGGGAVERLHPHAGQLPVGAVAHHAGSHAPQVVDQCQPEHDRHRPQLAQLQRRHFLVGSDEAADGFRIDPAIAMRDRLQGQVVHARQSGRRPLRQRRQLLAVGLGQMPARGVDLLLDQVEVVQQPLACRRDPHVVLDHARKQVAGIVEQAFVLLQPLEQAHRSRAWLQVMHPRQCPPVQLHLLDVEQRRAQRLLDRRRLGGGSTAHAPQASQATAQAQPTTEHSARLGHGVSVGEQADALTASCIARHPQCESRFTPHAARPGKARLQHVAAPHDAAPGAPSGCGDSATSLRTRRLRPRQPAAVPVPAPPHAHPLRPAKLGHGQRKRA